MSTPGPLLAVDASGCLSVARHRPPVRSASWHREGSSAQAGASPAGLTVSLASDKVNLP